MSFFHFLFTVQSNHLSSKCPVRFVILFRMQSYRKIIVWMKNYSGMVLVLWHKMETGNELKLNPVPFRSHFYKRREEKRKAQLCEWGMLCQLHHWVRFCHFYVKSLILKVLLSTLLQWEEQTNIQWWLLNIKQLYKLQTPFWSFRRFN